MSSELPRAWTCLYCHTNYDMVRLVNLAKERNIYNQNCPTLPEVRTSRDVEDLCCLVCGRSRYLKQSPPTKYNITEKKVEQVGKLKWNDETKDLLSEVNRKVMDQILSTKLGISLVEERLKEVEKGLTEFIQCEFDRSLEALQMKIHEDMTIFFEAKNNWEVDVNKK